MKRSLFSLLILLSTIIVIHAGDVITVNVSKPGSFLADLKKIVEDPRTVTDLKVDGNINGTDIKYLRLMAKGKEWYVSGSHRGYYISMRDSSGISSAKYSLSNLDLTDANIVSGGDYYYKGEGSNGPYVSSTYYYLTQNNTLQSNLFALTSLNKLTTPESATDIEGYALSSVNEVVITSKFKNIDKNAFSEVNKVTLQAEYDILPDSLFFDCENFTIKNSKLIQVIGNNVAYKKSTGSALPLNAWYIGENSYPNSTVTINYNHPSRLRFIGKNSLYKTFTTGNQTVSLDSAVALHSLPFGQKEGDSPKKVNITFRHGFTTDNPDLQYYINEINSTPFYLGNDNDNYLSGNSNQIVKQYNLKIANPETDGDSITIGEGAFYNNSQLESITVADGQYLDVEANAFNGCNNLKNFEGVGHCGNQAFANCKSLKSVTFKPNLFLSQNEIKDFQNAFIGCDSLEAFYGAKLDLSKNGLAARDGMLFNVVNGTATLILIPNTMEQLNWTTEFDGATEYAFPPDNKVNQINIVSGHIPVDIFYRFPNLQTISIEDSSNYVMVDGNIHEKGEKDGEIGKLALHLAGLPDTLELDKNFNTKIYFGEYPNLRKVMISRELTDISGIFPNAKIDTIVCRSSVPPTVDNDWLDFTFRKCSAKNSGFRVLVPVGSLDDYRDENCWWSRFGLRIRTSPNASIAQVANDGITIKTEGLTLMVDGVGEDMSIEVYSVDGRAVYAGKEYCITLPARGIYIVKTGSNITKVIAR